MSPLGRRILALKRERAKTTIAEDGFIFWGLTHMINIAVGGIGAK